MATMIICDQQLDYLVKQVEALFQQMRGRAGRQIDVAGAVFRAWTNTVTIQRDNVVNFSASSQIASQEEGARLKSVVGAIKDSLSTLRHNPEDASVLNKMEQSVQSLNKPRSQPEPRRGETLHSYEQMKSHDKSKPLYGDFVQNGFQGRFNQGRNTYKGCEARDQSKPQYGNKYGGRDIWARSGSDDDGDDDDD